MLEAEDRAAHGVAKGQETLGSRVHAAVHQDAGEGIHKTLMEICDMCVERL